ncbi:MAG: hypothetical protein GY913_35230 [Proteobacteria bacterium]|nr:hypothetical protein [Pseudomonadota bacterium]MCP4922184.1 hypothetical protein [Pseudomonadota bacterium]
MVVLHGGGATLKAFLAENAGGASPLASTWLNLADDEGFHVVLPEGIDKHWNGCRTDCTTGCNEDVDDVAFLTALVESVSADVSVDQDRIHVNGESNGGLMTQRIAREATSLAASVGVVNAAQPANNDCGDPTSPIAFIVGTADETMPWDGGNAGPGEMLSAEDTLAYWHTLDGCSGDGATEVLADLDPDDGSTVELQTWSCTEADVVRYVAEGGGHVPPSIDQQTSDTWDAFAGEQNHDLETAHALWAFFEAHPRRKLAAPRGMG